MLKIFITCSANRNVSRTVKGFQVSDWVLNVFIQQHDGGEEEEMESTLGEIQFLSGNSLFQFMPFGNLVKSIEEDIGTTLFASRVVYWLKIEKKIEKWAYLGICRLPNVCLELLQGRFPRWFYTQIQKSAKKVVLEAICFHYFTFVCSLWFILISSQKNLLWKLSFKLLWFSCTAENLLERTFQNGNW